MLTSIARILILSLVVSGVVEILSHMMSYPSKRLLSGQSTGDPATVASPRSRAANDRGAATQHARRTANEAAEPSLLKPGDLKYLGVFRLSGRREGYARLGYSTGVIGIGADGSQLWVASHPYEDRFARFPIPKTFSKDVDEWPVSQQNSAWQDVTGGHRKILRNTEVLGIVRAGEDWMYTVHDYYNVDGSHDVSLGLGEAGPWKTQTHSQITAGYLGLVPKEWQERLGGRIYCGLAGVAGRSLSSEGPAFVLLNSRAADSAEQSRRDDDEDSLQNQAASAAEDEAVDSVQETPLVVETTVLLRYSVKKPEATFTRVSRVTGTAFVATDSVYGVLFFGRRGIGKHWYGEHETDTARDPCSHSKGYHAEGTQSWVWLYDPHDLERVKQGKLQPASIAPRAHWSLDETLGFERCGQIRGAAYDPSRGRLYLSAKDPGRTGREPQPAIHVFEVPGVE